MKVPFTDFIAGELSTAKTYLPDEFDTKAPFKNLESVHEEYTDAEEESDSLESYDHEEYADEYDREEEGYPESEDEATNISTEEQFEQYEEEATAQSLEDTLTIENEFDIDPNYGVTEYLTVGVGGGLPLKTGVFLPTGYKRSGNLDIVVFLHGHVGRKKDGKWIPDPGFLKDGIKYYWKNYSNIRDHFRLNSGNAILIAPTLGDLSSGNYGRLGAANGFDQFISTCIRVLKQKNYLETLAMPYRIILAAHSGGGNPLGKILAQENDYLTYVSEVWGFDCLYGEKDGGWVCNYAKWIRSTNATRATKYFLHFSATRRPTSNGVYLQEKFSDRVKNIDLSKLANHQTVIEYAWKNELNKVSLFDFFARQKAFRAIPEHEETFYAHEDRYEVEEAIDSENDEHEEIDEILSEEEDLVSEEFSDELLQHQVPALARILYGGFDLQIGDNDRLGKHGGIVSSTNVGKPYVAQLQDDLRTLGFGYVGRTSDGQFGTNTQMAIREFQLHAKLAFVAQQTYNVALVYSDSLIQTPNTSVYTGPVSGVVNAATRSLLQVWIQNSWRCPVIIEAWNMVRGARSSNAHSNLWKHDDLRDTGPRMFAVDFSNHYQAGSTRRLLDRQVLGDYATYSRWSGPRSVPPTHSWTEAEFFPNNAIFPGLNPASPAFGQLTASQQSTYRVVRAVSEVECNGFYDGLNAYDDVYISIPMFHAVLGETNDAYGGELGGFISYFAQYFPAEFNRLFGFCGINATTSWSTNGRPLLKPSRRFTSVISIENEGGTHTAINTTNEATYNWFRSWHWFYRFSMAGRTSRVYQQALWNYSRTRLRTLLSTPWDGTLQVGTIAPR
ncbi:MAG TPA: peptidoglycan-binding domain-containing protein, partial [Chitinophagaceae bacterium]|nr:peptidoglycan-binding domain-containing protein [Chitinophagaceae bacterium]